MLETFKKNDDSKNDVERKLKLFRQLLTALFKKLKPEILRKTDIEGITQKHAKQLWDLIDEQYKEVKRIVETSHDYLRNPKIIDEYQNNTWTPVGKSITQFLNKNLFPKSDIPEKIAIAYRFIVKQYPKEWLISKLKEDATNLSVFHEILENKTFYLGYYSNNKFEIEYGVLEVEGLEEFMPEFANDIPGDQATLTGSGSTPASNVRLEYYFPDGTKKEISATGKMFDTGQNLFIELKGDPVNGNIATLIIMHTGGKVNQEFRFLVGTYVTTQTNNTPVSGLTICQQYHSRQAVKDSMHDKHSLQYQVIKHILSGKRVIGHSQEIGKLSDFSSFNSVKTIMEKYAGLYEIKYISVNKNKVFKILGILKISGQIVLKQHNTELSGMLKTDEDGSTLYASIGYDKKPDDFKLQVVLQGERKMREGSTIKGVYAGVGLHSKEPVAGRILLTYKRPYSSDETKMVYESTPEPLPLDSSSLTAAEINFFYGEEDNFIETQAFLKSKGIFPANENEITKLLKRVDQLEKGVAKLKKRRSG